MNYLAKVASQLWRHQLAQNFLVVPGGKNADNQGTTASFALAVRYNEEIEEVELWLVPRANSFVDTDQNEEEIFFLEEPKGTAVRELMEETGMKATKMIDLTFRQRPHYEKIAGVHLQYVYLVLSYDDRNAHKNPPKDGKTLIPLWVPLSKVRSGMAKGNLWILDAFEQYLSEHPQLITSLTRVGQKKVKPALVLN